MIHGSNSRVRFSSSPNDIIMGHARPLRTPITAESLKFLLLFMLMVVSLQVFALLLASNVVRPEAILTATPQPLVNHEVNYSLASPVMPRLPRISSIPQPALRPVFQSINWD